MPVERASGGTSLIDVLDRVLDKGIVIDAWVRVSLVGIDLLTVEARVVVASIDTYIKYSEAVSQVPTVSRPALERRSSEELAGGERLAPGPARRLDGAGGGSPARGGRGISDQQAVTRGPRRPLTDPTPRSGAASARGPGWRWSTPCSRSRRCGPAPCSPCAGWSATPASSAASAPWSRARRDGSSGLTGLGLSMASVDAFSLDLNDRTHPLVVALAGSEPVAFRNSGREGCGARSRPPWAPSRSCAVPLSGSGEQRRHRPRPPAADRPRRRPRRARTCAGPPRFWASACSRSGSAAPRWTSGATSASGAGCSAIINAVTDPILLTDSEGRILVANASAEMLLTADDQKSEGRRRAVALNNMLFSASIFTAERGRRGPTRHELLLVDPTEGQDLLFEVHEHAGQDPGRRDRHGLGAAQRHRPAPRHRGDRGELPPAARSPRPRPAPSATGST